MMLDVSMNLAPTAGPKPKAPSSSSLLAIALAQTCSGKENSIPKRSKVEGRIHPQPRPHNGRPKKRIIVKSNHKCNNKMTMEKTKVIFSSPLVRCLLVQVICGNR